MMIRDALRKLWIAACLEDGIDPDSKFVVFSEGNQKARDYDTVALQAAEAATSHRILWEDWKDQHGQKR